MSAPSGKPSPQGTRPSGLIETMAIENADTDKAANDIPIESDADTPSERSRSDKREVNALMSRGPVLPQNNTTPFSRARQSNATKDQQIQALKDYYERQDESRRVQLSQLESIIQQQSEQIKTQQLQAEPMNMRMGKLLNTLGPLPVPVVQTATAVLPPATKVTMSAPLSSFASASASKPVSANQDLWETIGQEGAVPLFDAIDPNSEITRQCSPTLPPTSLAASEKGEEEEKEEGVTHQVTIQAMTMHRSAVINQVEDERTKVVRNPHQGAADHGEVCLGTEMMMMEMVTMMSLMTVTVTVSLSVE